MDNNDIARLLNNIVLDNDQYALKSLMKHFAPSLYHFALSIVHNSPEAEEIVSDVFVKIWQKRRELPECEKLKYYLFKAVKHTSLNYLKSAHRRSEHYHNWKVAVSQAAGRTPEDIIISKEQTDSIARAVEMLPPRCRQIFVLVKEEGLTYAEVAALLEISPATVNVQMTIALKKMWNILDPQLYISRS